MDDLRERLKNLKEEQGVSYKCIAKNLGIGLSKFYNFTSEARELPVADMDNLDIYLKNRGY